MKNNIASKEQMNRGRIGCLAKLAGLTIERILLAAAVLLFCEKMAPLRRACRRPRLPGQVSAIVRTVASFERSSQWPTGLNRMTSFYQCRPKTCGRPWKYLRPASAGMENSKR